MTKALTRITWLHFAAVWGICTLSGAAVGVCTFVFTELVRAPSPDLLGYIPFVVINALAVAAVWAVVASLVGAIPLLLMQQHMASASPAIWRVMGGAVGALVGALPLFYAAVILAVNGEKFEYSEPSPVIYLVVRGALSGVLVAWWYRAKVLRGMQAERAVAP